MEVIGALLMWVIGLTIYFVPSIVAHKKDHKQKLPIILVNVFFGATLIGWVGALVWCFISPVDVENVKSGGVADEIEKLSELKDKGVLTEDEFKAKKEQLLSS